MGACVEAEAAAGAATRAGAAAGAAAGRGNRRNHFGAPNIGPRKWQRLTLIVIIYLEVYKIAV